MAGARNPGPAIRFFRRSARHVWWLVLGTVLLVSGAKVSMMVRRRNAFDATLPGTVQNALDEARRSPASRWAPEDLAAAEETYRRGMGQLREQQARLFLFRNLRPPADTLMLAKIRVQEFVAAGTVRMGDARIRAQRALAQAAETLETLRTLEAGAFLPRQAYTGISAARMGFAEASAYLDAGAYLEAEARAREILAQARAASASLEAALVRFKDEAGVRTWRRWIAETISWSREQQAVALVVIKEKNLLEVYNRGRKVASLAADMGANSLAQKYREGDRATPEGRYRITQIKERGQTRYYRALLLDYPTRDDMRRIDAAKRAGTIPAGARAGGLIEIHGKGGLGNDWTNGCVAVTNAHMDELFRLVRVGTPVTIVGGDGSGGVFSSLAERLNREI